MPLGRLTAMTPTRHSPRRIAAVRNSPACCIAVPAISTGIDGFPPALAAPFVQRAVADLDVHLVLRTPCDAGLFERHRFDR